MNASALSVTIGRTAEVVAKRDLGAQLQRLYNIAVYNLREAETEEGRSHAKGQMNGFYAVAVSYGIDLVEVDC